VMLYGDLAGQQENLAGTPLRALFAAALHINWPAALVATAKTCLWQGNNSCTTFGSWTIWLMLALIAAAAVSYLRRRPTAAERVVLAGIACYAAGLVYDHVLQFYSTKGAVTGVAPWHVQLLAAPAICILLINTGRWMRAAMCAVWAYVICATYIAKLIPLYGGYAGRPVRL